LETHDVVVAGGGLSGLMAARKAAEGGVDVLLVEKENTLGRKVCAEAMSSQTVIDAELESSKDFITNRIDGVHVYPPDESRMVNISSVDTGVGGGYEGYIVDKPLFLTALAEAAESKGARLMLNTAVVDIAKEQDYVRIRVDTPEGAKEIGAKILIGCDGVTSVVARKFFTRKNYELIPCVQYTLSSCSVGEERFTEFYLGREVAPLGYAWIFPKGKGVANVGIGVRGKPAKPYLDKFLKNHSEKFRNSKVMKVGAAPVPVGGLIEEVVADNLMLCGDSCGQVIPITGAGIHSGIAAGKIAGEVAAKAVLEKNLSRARLAEYPSRYDVYWGSRIRSSLKVLRLISAMSDNELNELAKVLGGKDIIDLANGLNIKQVAQMLLRHPMFAVKVAKLLLG